VLGSVGSRPLGVCSAPSSRKPSADRLFFRRKISSSLSRRFLSDSSAQTRSTAGLTPGGDKHDRLLAQDPFDHFPVHIGQAEIAALEPIVESGVIQAELVQKETGGVVRESRRVGC
jgi:hypothetical protein